MIPTYPLDSGTLWVNQTTNAFPGTPVINIDGQNWKTIGPGDLNTYVGHRVGVVVSGNSNTGVIPGQPVSVQTAGVLPAGLYNLGPGSASTVVVTTNGLTRGNTGQVIGICDSAGAVVIFPTIAGSYAAGSRIVGEIAGYALNTTPLASGQTWVYDGTQLTPQTVQIGSASSVTGTGLWYSASGTLNAAAVTLSGDLQPSALSGNNLPVTVIGLQGNPVSTAAPSAGNTLGWNAISSRWTPVALNLAGGSGYVTGTLPVANIAPGTSAQVMMSNATPAATWTTISQDATLSATGVATVVGLRAVSIPAYPVSAGSYVLVYAEGSNSYTWTLTSSIGGGYSAAGDLTGNSSAQYVTTISGNAGGGGDVALSAGARITAASTSHAYIDLTAANASFGYGKFLSLIAPSLDTASAVALSIGTATTNAIAIGKSGIATTITGSLAQTTGTFSLTGNGASSLTTSSGAITINSFAALTLQNNGSTIGQFGQAAADFLAFGSVPAGSGYLRIPGSANQRILQAGTIPILGITSVSGQTFLSGYTAGAGVTLEDAGTPVIGVLSSSSNPSILFNDNGVSGTSNGGVIAWSGANASGQGMSLVMLGQSAKVGSNANSGAAELISGAKDGTGVDGGVLFGFNYTGSGSLTDFVQFVGANTSAARGNLQWSSALTPKWSQASAAYHNSNATDWVWAPQVNTDGTSTTGRSAHAIVNLGAPPNSSTAEAYLNVQRNGTSLLWLGQQVSGTYAGFYAGSNTPSATNFALIGNGTHTVLNAPTGNVYFALGGNSAIELSSSSELLPASGGGTVALGDATNYWGSAFIQNISIIAAGVGGNSTSSTAFNFASTTAIALTAGTQNLTAGQIATPYLAFTGASQSGSPGTTLVLPANHIGTIWFLDFVGVTGLGTNTVLVKVGTGTHTLTVNAASVWLVVQTGANSLWSQLLS